MNNNAPTIRCIRRMASGILTPFGFVCTSRKQLSYNRADEINMDRDIDGGGVDSRVLWRAGVELEFSERDTRGCSITHRRTAYDADAGTTRR